MDTLAQAVSGHFTLWDWAVLVGYLVVTTVLGGALAGKQATIRDFFLGGRKLPWYAVSGSIIATEISALTFISVPYVVFKPDGNFTYLQLGVFGSFFARIIVGYVLVPAYYKREIYSPYDYMGNQLGGSVRSVTTALFALGGMLAQSARVYLTAVVLQLILSKQLAGLSASTGISPMTWSIWIIGAVAIAWTVMGGITTVIWTDVILFMVFLSGAFIALGVIAAELPGGLGEILSVGYEAGKFQFFDFDPSPLKAYTIWTAVIASTWGGLGAYGTDQLLAQRMFCCKGPRQARAAIIASTLGQIITFTVMLVGVGLYVFYQRHPLAGEALTAYNEKGDRIFPIFILSVIPTGLTGLIIAGVFAAAISSLDSILAALSQTVMSAFYLPWRKRRLQRAGAPAAVESSEDRRTVLVSRIFVVFWGIVLCLMAQLAAVASEYYPSILDLGLAMAGYAGGALLAGFLLAFLKLGIDGRGYCWSAPLSVFVVFAMVWHQPWTHAVCWGGGGALLATWIWALLKDSPTTPQDWGKTGFLVTGIALMLLVSYFGYWLAPPPPGKLLFDASAEYADYLDNGTLPEELRKRFIEHEDHDLYVSPQAELSTAEKGRRWLIHEKQKKTIYTVLKEEDKLKSYKGWWLFRIPSDYVGILDNGTNSDALREQFASHGVRLSPGAAISASKKGKEWLIIDEDANGEASWYAVSQAEAGTSLDVYTGEPTFLTVAWPWYAPVGCTVAFVFGFLLARRKQEPATTNSD